MDSITISAASLRHLPKILEIEKDSFPSPWDIGTFTSALEDRRYEGYVALEGGTVAGYCFAINLTNMIHVLNLAVAPAFRRRGIARQLLQKVLLSGISKKKMYAVLEVRISNVPAITLYSTMGFTQVSIWHKYYSDTSEDANVMVKDLRLNMTKDVECTILKNEEVASDTFHLMLQGDMPLSEPGQFAMVKVCRSNEPFLRRPLAILSQDGGTIEMLYRVKGSGTQLLSQKKPEERLNILGPLGESFKKPIGGKIIYVAGGTGLPPILSLAERIKAGTFIFGAKSAREIPFPDRIEAIPGTETLFMTEDGTKGQKGLASDALRKIVLRDGSDVTVYGCGPLGLLKATSAIAATHGVRCQLSLEERMSCGFGACSGCIVKTVHGNMRVCREGPVFNAYDIDWSL
jgi:dihydroorotate dehydrogenase electron transfer subunit